jgi:hypothetical protein
MLRLKHDKSSSLRGLGARGLGARHSGILFPRQLAAKKFTFNLFRMIHSTWI